MRLRRRLITQYDNIMHFLDVLPSAIDTAQVVPQEIADLATQVDSDDDDGDTDDLQCYEVLGHVTHENSAINYKHECGACGLPTYYPRRPPACYPLPLCLNDFCLSEQLRVLFMQKLVRRLR